MFVVYILYAVNSDRYYVGHCEDISVRLNRHNFGGVLSTKAFIPWTLVYTENYATRSAAASRELAIKKKKSRKYIQYLIENGGTGRHVPM